MTDRELLEQILAKVTSIDKRLEDVESDVVTLKSDVATLKSDVSEIKDTVTKNYDKTLEFYAMQKEHNTEVFYTLDQLGARQEIFENQTIKNTADLRRIK